MVRPSQAWSQYTHYIQKISPGRKSRISDWWKDSWLGPSPNGVCPVPTGRILLIFLCPRYGSGENWETNLSEMITCLKKHSIWIQCLLNFLDHVHPSSIIHQPSRQPIREDFSFKIMQTQFSISQVCFQNHYTSKGFAKKWGCGLIYKYFLW